MSSCIPAAIRGGTEARGRPEKVRPRAPFARLETRPLRRRRVRTGAGQGPASQPEGGQS